MYYMHADSRLRVVWNSTVTVTVTQNSRTMVRT